MLIDRPNIVEGSSIVNATIASGSDFPVAANAGELFYLSSALPDPNPPFLTLQPGLFAMGTDGIWMQMFAEGEQSPRNHIYDTIQHITATQNTFLDSINLSTVTPFNFNCLAGVNALIQDQLNTIVSNTGSHASDASLHLSASQNTFLDGLTASFTQVNYLAGATPVTSSVQGQIDGIVTANGVQDGRLTTLETITVPAVQTNLNTHATNGSLHLSTAQNTLLDGIEVGGILAADINQLSGAAALSSTIATLLAGLESNKLNRNGSIAMTGNLNAGGFTVTGLATPVNPSDAARKDYVDSLVNGMHWFEPARAATTANIDLGAGGLLLIDGVSLATSERVLVKDQSVPAENGIYLASAGAWSRAPDYATAEAITTSALYILEGTAQGKSTWIQNNIITSVGVDPINFIPSSGPVVNTAGGGITLGVGGEVAVKEGAGLAFDGNSALIADLYPGGGLMVTTNNASEATITTTSAQLALTNTGVVAGTYNNVSTAITPFTVDSKGRIVSAGAGVTITPAFASVTGKPTTLSGYGIVDAVLKSGDTMTGNLSFANGTSIAGQMPGPLGTFFSTGAYGIAQGDNKTHFGFLTGGVYYNYIRGNTTYIDGNLSLSTALPITSGGTGATTANGARAALNAGSLTLEQNPQSNNYTIAASDSGKNILSANTGAQTITVPTNAAVPIPVDTILSITNNGTGPITLNTTGLTVYLAGTSAPWASGGQIIVRGIMTLLKTATDTWFASTGTQDTSSLLKIDGTQAMTGTLTGSISSLTMASDTVARGSFVARSTGTGDANLAGMTFYNDAYAVKLGVRADGYFGLGGWSRGVWSWYSDPSGNMVAAGSVTAYSDPRLKRDVKPIANALDIINQLNGVRFTWKQGFAHTELKAGRRDIGVLANEVEAVLPEIVTESIELEGEKYKTVAYDKLVPVLIEAIKELQARIVALESAAK